MLKLWQYYPIFILVLGQSQADVFDECNGADRFSFVESPKSCAHYIYCDGDDSYDGECEDREYFSAELQLCEPMGDIDCRSGLPIPAESTNNTPNSESAPAPSENNSGPETEVVSSTVATTLSTTVAPPGPSVTVTSRPPTNETGGTISTGLYPSIEVAVTTLCPRQDNQSRIVLMPNRNSCSDYFICYQGDPLPMSCAASLHFNSRSGKCDHPENVKCLSMSSNPREQCKRHTIDVYPHPDNCNYFYQCRLGFLIVQQCPFFYGWDYEKRSCVALSQAKCYNKVQQRLSK
ncbi:uncharacterized protein Dana_GF24469 [Drosophila ananassae]|uniref:Chitin-binding type-2 domain-containing protein n=2 Tax=Drosophila ananassae TaxID=7217 RepID=B3M500_DROAN|nr:uncharacterized protein Dana_GF24469 [Drosophila ananassae]